MIVVNSPPTLEEAFGAFFGAAAASEEMGFLTEELLGVVLEASKPERAERKAAFLKMIKKKKGGGKDAGGEKKMMKEAEELWESAERFASALKSSAQSFTPADIYGAIELTAVLGENATADFEIAAALAENSMTAGGHAKFDEALAEKEYKHLEDLALMAKSDPKKYAKRAYREIASHIRMNVLLLGYDVKKKNAWAYGAPILAVGLLASGVTLAALATGSIALILGAGVAGLGVQHVVNKAVVNTAEKKHIPEGWRAVADEHGDKFELSADGQKIKAFIAKLVALLKTVPAPHPYDEKMG